VTLGALAHELHDVDVPASEANVLANLSDGAEYSVSELAARVGSRATTMTAILDRLERRGWLARTPHPTDRRALVVALTPSGRRVAHKVRAAYDRVEAELLGRLTPAAARTLRSSLRLLGDPGDE
jgi:DNA-binding MarR family transcriptional regulator